jgi:hypothetical protein
LEARKNVIRPIENPKIILLLYSIGGLTIFNIGCINKKEWKKEGIIITIE